MPREIDVVEVLLAHSDAVHDSIRKTLPAIVTQVHGQTVDVQVAIKNPLYRPYNLAVGSPTSPLTFEDAPVLSDVPWGTLAAGGFSVWLPPAVGNLCILHFTDLSMDVLRGSDGSQPVEPGLIGKHTMDSCVAVPYFRVDSKQLTDAPPNTMVVGVDGQSAQIRISPGSIQLGSTGAGGAVALANKVDPINTDLQALATALAAVAVNVSTGDVSGASWAAVISAASTLASAVAPTGSALVTAGS